MKVKSVTIETDKGAEITMSLEEVDDFMKAMRRLKKSCAEPKPEADKNSLNDSEMLAIQLQLQRIEEQCRIEKERKRQMVLPQTWDSANTMGINPVSNQNFLIGGSSS